MSTAVRVHYAPRGSAQSLFRTRAPEILVSGPAGTGKSRACLTKLHLAALKKPGMRGLFSSPCRTRLVVRVTNWPTHYGIWSHDKLIARGYTGPTSGSNTRVFNLRLKPYQLVSFQARPDWGTF